MLLARPLDDLAPQIFVFVRISIGRASAGVKSADEGLIPALPMEILVPSLIPSGRVSLGILAPYRLATTDPT
jgi:hypothetical protein